MTVVAVKRVILISILVFCMLAPMNAQAQATPVGVEIECDDSTIDINVHPEQNQPVSVSCTVTNTGTFKEQIDIDWSVDGNDFNVDVPGDTSWDIEAGDSKNFTAVFTASPRIEVKSEDFNITATVVSVTIGGDPITIPLGQFGSTAEVGGTVSSLAYSRIDLEVSNPTTRNIEVSEEESIQFTIFNDGNRIDDLEVIVVNQQELEDAGFKFVSDSFFRSTVNPSSSSEQGTILIQAPSSASSEISVQVELLAFSKLDDSDTAFSETTVRIVVAASSGGGGALGDLDSMTGENWAMIGMAGGGLIGLILLLVIISRLTKKTAGKQKIAQKEAKKAAKAERKSRKKGKKAKPVVVEESSDDDFDFDDDLDDDFDDDFDFDDL